MNAEGEEEKPPVGWRAEWKSPFATPGKALLVPLFFSRSF